jgi:hypothetical protein
MDELARTREGSRFMREQAPSRIERRRAPTAPICIACPQPNPAVVGYYEIDDPPLARRREWLCESHTALLRMLQYDRWVPVSTAATESQWKGGEDR